MTATASGPSAAAQTLASWGQAGSARPASASESVWLSEFRAASRRAFLAAGFPKPADDAWKHMGLDALLKPEWYPATADWHAQLPAGASGVDMRTWDRLSALPEPAARKNRPGAFADLNATFFKNALHVRVPKSVCSLQPLRLTPAPAEASLSDGWMIHPRASVQLEPGSRLDVILDCSRLPACAGFLNLVVDIGLGENTALNLVILGSTAARAVALLDLSVSQQRDSVFRAFCFESRPALNRLDLSVALNGENASTDLFGLALLGGESRAFHHLNVDHRVPHTQSQQVFKSVLADAARFEYDSLVTIRPEAPHASSEQLNKNLLLSDNARAYARPQLAIQTDEVQCHHGATVGQMNAEELFYLRTRGIDPSSASELVLRGFVNDLLKEIPVASVSAELCEQAHARLEEIVR